MNITDMKQILNLEKPDLRLTTNINHEQTTTNSFNFFSLEQTKIKNEKNNNGYHKNLGTQQQIRNGHSITTILNGEEQ